MDADMTVHDLMRTRLSREVQRALDQVAAEGPRFIWGRHDCVLWAANILVAVGLPDPVAEIRGKYRSATGARRLIGKDGLEAKTAEAAQRLGWREMKPVPAGGLPTYPVAKPGDIGLVPVFVFDLMRTVPCCVIRGPHGDWHGPIDRGYSCSMDHALIRAWDILPAEAA